MSEASRVVQAIPRQVFSSIDADGFRNGMRLVPGAVSIIATSFGGQKRGLAATAVSSLAAEPPSLLVCVNQSASAFEFFGLAGYFSVNQLPTRRLDLAKVFSSSAPADRARRFKEDEWTELVTGAPILHDAVVSFDCELVESKKFGTHSIFIGRIVSFKLNEQAEPMIYLRGKFSEAAPLSAS